MGKLAPRTLPCIFLGHNPTSPYYLFLHPPSGCLVRSRDVVFDESTPYYSSPPSTDPLPPLTHPLVWSDTTPPQVLPPPPILPPPPPPSFPSHGAPPVGATLRFAFGLLSVCVHACVHGMVVGHEMI
ncbi:unnamed protein product [Closterium sp. NIES-54]